MRLKIGKFVVRHNKIEYGENDVFEIGKKEGERLLEMGVAKETSEAVTEKETPDQSSAKVALDAEALYENTVDFNTLKVDELKAVCAFLGIPATGNKPDLVAAILKSEDANAINLDEMDEAALRTLAAEEEIDIPAGTEEPGIRDILALALAE